MIRETPKIFIDDTHLRKPTKVQIKSSVITSSMGQRYNAQVKNGGSYLEKYQVNPPQPQFKPLVQVDPTLLSTSRCPLQNPRPGDYLLNKTASTEGIASKKSLELKKRYLLGEQGNGNKIQKSGSTSVLDSKIRSFQSNISECQKLLNPSNDISPSMKTFLDRTRLGENTNNDLMRSKTTTILNDLKVQITIQKATSGVSIDNEKENVFVNSKNELNKGMEYSETVNTTLLDSINKKSPSTPTNNQQTIIETIDLVTPEKTIIETINLATPEKQKSINDINLIDMPSNVKDQHMETSNSPNCCTQSLLTTDSNKIIDLACESPVKSDKTIIEEIRPDVSKNVKERPDILKHIDSPVKNLNKAKPASVRSVDEECQTLLCKSDDEEKRDSPEKLEEQYEHDTVQIQVPTIPWRTHKSDNLSSTTGSSCTSQSSSVEDIQHYILESTTSPDTQTGAVVNIGGGAHKVPRVEIHDTSGTLMQIDSLMIIDGEYVGDPEDLKYMEIPEGIIIPAVAEVKTSVVEEETEVDIEEPVTATPEPAERTVVEADEQPPPLPEKGPPLPERGPPKIKPADLKFDTKNENKIESLKNLPLIVEEHVVEHSKAIKPIMLNLSSTRKSHGTPTTLKVGLNSPMSPLVDNDKTPTADLISRGSDSETELTGTGQVLTETELSDWTADDCISENFVDMEFVLNSNKGTIKRNKKGKKKLNSPKLPSTNEVICEVAKVAPVAEFEGILQHIDIDDIEFMDTGSEGSYGEAYSATNTALIRNRGYMEFIEPASTSNRPSHHSAQVKSQDSQYNSVTTKRDQKLGIDYIEQGAYIMQQDDMMKTPVNDVPNSTMTTKITLGEKPGSATHVMTQSLTDSNTLNDLDEDSLCVITPNSQAFGSTTTTTTADESEALTIVTSPLDTYSPKMKDAAQVALTKNVETADGSTPSSSDKNPKTSLSTYTPSSTSATTTSPNKAASTSIENTPAAAIQRTEELSYEEYVRALQQKITQISTARDSLETRKQRRKSSKSDTPLTLNATSTAQTVIEQPQPQQQQPNDDKLVSEHVHKVPEIPTLTRKLEEITKERTKQKDLIHDLVMDKLQSKKQLNAEKRLHRTRQRNMLTSGYTSGSSLSPTPKIAAASTTNDANCTNKAHYHMSTAAGSNFEENNSLQKSSTSGYMPTYRSSSTRATTRPFSAYLEDEQLNVYQLNKTGSFSHVLQATKPFSGESLASSAVYAYATPKTAIVVQQPNSVSVSTESLRKEARTRARLKSNSELGLSPEEKMQLLRKRLYAEHTLNGKCSTTTDIDTTQNAETQQSQNYSHHRKISVSKSVNDLVYISSSQQGNVDAADANSDMRTHASKQADFTSDPNLLAISTAAQSNQKTSNSKSTRRPKDPERRKSLIQSLSSFFHKNSSNPVKEQSGITASGSNSAQTERAFTSGGNNSSNTNITSVASNESMFSRFRISPKSKEKSKDKDGLERITNNTAKIPIVTSTTTAPTRHTRSHERSSSQGCIYSLHTAATTSSLIGVGVHLQNRNISLSTSNSLQSNHQHKHNTKRPTITTTDSKPATAFSSSSPQLCVHKPYHTFANISNSNTNMAHVGINVADEQTPPPIPPLPFNYQRSDDESYATETREQKKQRAINKAVRQAELKRLRIAQEIQREQEEIEVQLKELEARGVLIEKALRGEGQQNMENFDAINGGHNDEKMLKELLDIWRNITHLKKRDEELSIRQQELQLEHRHAQLKEELNLRLSCNKLDKSSADVAAEGAILNEMLEIVAKRAALRPTGNDSSTELISVEGSPSVAATAAAMTLNMTPSYDNDESNI